MIWDEVDDWILTEGAWDDSGVWEDDDIWRDEVWTVVPGSVDE